LIRLLLLLAPALGQDAVHVPALNAQLFRPSLDSRGTLWTDDSALAAHGSSVFRLAAHYVDDPLLVRYSDGREQALLAKALELDAMAGVTLWRLRLGAVMPSYPHASGELGREGGLGDLGLDAKICLLDGGTREQGLALTGRLGLPTSTMDLALGSAGPSGELALVSDHRWDQFSLAANLGTRLLPAAQLADLTLDDQLFMRLGAAWAISDAGGVSLDAAAAFTYAEGLIAPHATPVEALFGGWFRFGERGALRAGLGKGFSNGIGSPDWRAVALISLEPRPPPRDQDLDGLDDHQDSCPLQAEDADGWADDDGCPDATPRVSMVFQEEDGTPIYGVEISLKGSMGEQQGSGVLNFELQPGSYALYAQAEGYHPLQAEVVVPDQPELQLVHELAPLTGLLRLHAQDSFALPVEATWRVGPLAATGSDVEHELRFGSWDVWVSAEGFRPQVAQAEVKAGRTQELTVTLEVASVALIGDRIDIGGAIRFLPGLAVLEPDSFTLLDEVASLMMAHPEITRLRVEGHSDSRGSAQSNLLLSADQAAAVREYLEDWGVAAERLQSVGYGESRPLDERQVPEAWERNRRIEFIVLERE